MRPLRFGQIIWVTATTILAGGIVACSGVDTPNPPGLGGSSGSTANGGSSGNGRGGSGGLTSNGGTSSGGTSNGGSSNGGSSNGGTANGGSSNGGSSNNNGGTAGDAPDAGFEPDSGANPDAGATTTNLVTNFDAEAATIAPWIAGQAGTVAIATDQFNSGSQSVVTVGRDATWKGVGVDLFGLVTSGTTYEASVFMRVSAAPTATGKFTRRVTCDGVNQYATIQQNVTVSDTSWTQLSGTFTVPTDVDCPNMSSVLLFVENVDAALQIYADDMVVMEQAP